MAAGKPTAMATKKKKIVSKDDLRRLMREKQTTAKITGKKIEHPFAKYNSLDQIVCVLCNTVVKSNLLWPAHLQSRGHKEISANYKQRPATVELPAGKRKSDILDTGTVPSKKQKGIIKNNNSGIPADFFDNGKSPSQVKGANSVKPKSILAHYSSSDDEDDDDNDSQAKEPDKPTTKLKSSSSSLPPDFFDVGVMPSASTSKDTEEEEETKPSAMADILPEGFFDDPKIDAKVRQVEYVDKMEEEWELFQKAMKEETHVSEVIIEEEDEQVNVDRNIDEIDEQIQCWKEVNDLEKKKEEIMQKGPQDNKKDSDSDEDLSEAKLDEFLDWRSKKSWR